MALNTKRRKEGRGKDIFSNVLRGTHGLRFTVDKELQEGFALSWTSVPQRGTVICQQSKPGESNTSVLFRPAIKFHSDLILGFSGKGT